MNKLICFIFGHKYSFTAKGLLVTPKRRCKRCGTKWIVKYSPSSRDNSSPSFKWVIYEKQKE